MKINDYRMYIIEVGDNVYQRTDSSDWQLLVDEEWVAVDDPSALEEQFENTLDTENHIIEEGYPWEQE